MKNLNIYSLCVLTILILGCNRSLKQPAEVYSFNQKDKSVELKLENDKMYFIEGETTKVTFMIKNIELENFSVIGLGLEKIDALSNQVTYKITPIKKKKENNISITVVEHNDTKIVLKNKFLIPVQRK
ncbi:hypothetical protein Celal_3754 [Cellulophaga algicola DSM 14237]|uniref:Lipoprotein n=1 Tax=Cellulophaga algicola (strain DSM 14237 / IC166 / ACAM 630) TaxID=688270 RepID=E6XAP1_CELAD|nr:hypothetical protein [Cellulophaga algicola]ADV51003.1 hypothetical protein Celal_3754 [Cellulophaga algicola DSM 14237]